ncbi:MAG: hypothetical protein SVG88_14700 [Halobacteriales archaeon]|nr:hypothetical protein [Halobacteriales archaeon]
MADLRTLLAAVLGIGIGVVCLAYPEAIIRAQTAGRMPHDRSGEYGTDATTADRWRRLVQLLGLGAVIAGGYFAVIILTDSGVI